MGRTLNTTVMVDGTVYAAGTPESEIDGTVLTEGVWDGEADPEDEVDSNHPVTAQLREVVEYIAELHLTDREVPVSRLLESAVEVFGDAEDAEETGEGDGQDAKSAPSETVDYTGKSVDDLKVEAEKRGLEVEGTGANGNVVKDDVLKALQADDARTA